MKINSRETYARKPMRVFYVAPGKLGSCDVVSELRIESKRRRGENKTCVFEVGRLDNDSRLRVMFVETKVGRLKAKLA